jgi:DUF4097 and DUF4098 domain-containing protein YvlB
MTSTQKIIKYAAICLALFITVSIIGSIIVAIFGIFGFTNVFKYSNNKTKPVDSYNTFSNVKNMNITLDTANFDVITGDELKVEADNITDKFVCKQDGDTLVINENENKFNLFGMINNVIDTKITLYIPEGYNFDNVELNSGVGNTNFNTLKSDSLTLKLGVGDFTGNKLESNTTDIKGGVGDIKIENSKLNDMNLKSGVGNTRISGKITGKSKVSAGVGDVYINVNGKKSEYTLSTNSGIGGIDINESNSNESTASIIPIYRLDVDGGIGNITVNFN